MALDDDDDEEEPPLPEEIPHRIESIARSLHIGIHGELPSPRKKKTALSGRIDHF